MFPEGGGTLSISSKTRAQGPDGVQGEGQGAVSTLGWAPGGAEDLLWALQRGCQQQPWSLGISHREKAHPNSATAPRMEQTADPTRWAAREPQKSP